VSGLGGFSPTSEVEGGFWPRGGFVRGGLCPVTWLYTV